MKIIGTDLHADDLIDQELSRGLLNGPDRGLFTELSFGVIRRQNTLDHYLKQLVQQPLERLEIPVLLFLRLGLYQLLYLDRVPGHAAVHETVELARQYLPRASGLVNAVLRNFIRKRESLADPELIKDNAARIAAAHSVPLWLAEQWLMQFSPVEAAALAAASSEIPPCTIRTNTLKTTREELITLFAASGINSGPSAYSPEGIKLVDRCRVIDLPGFDDGLFAVQDEASQIAVHLLEPGPGQSVLDVCAAPGGKTTHIAQLMAGTGELVATDLNTRKVRKITEGAARLGLTGISAVVTDALAPGYQNGRMFDRILLDAPCSGLGVIRRNPEAKWRLDPASFRRFAERQRHLLANVAPLLKPGGIMIYSTCSTADEENEGVIDDFLSCNPEFMLEDMAGIFTRWPGLFSTQGSLRLWPHLHGTDGFFAARLRRTDR